MRAMLFQVRPQSLSIFSRKPGLPENTRDYLGFGESVFGQALGAIQSAHIGSLVNVLGQRSFDGVFESWNERGFSFQCCRKSACVDTLLRPFRGFGFVEAPRPRAAARGYDPTPLRGNS